MPRKLPEISTTQLIASAIATAAAAFGASTLGVYGTIIGAALMSVISTAGSSIAQHYLDQGREQVRELTQKQVAARRRGAAKGAAEQATRADPTRTAVWSGDPNATRVDPPPGDPGATRLDPGAGGDPNATRMDPVETVADSLAAEAGEEAVQDAARRSAWKNTVEWAKTHWVKLAVSSGVVFAVVIGGITLYEAATGEPIGKGGGKGLTVTQVLGGGGGAPVEGPTQSPSGGPAEPGATPGQTPTGEAPATEPGVPPEQAPTQAPTGPSVRQPAPQPTTSAPTAPDTPAPTGGPGDGGPEGGGQDPGGADPQRGTGSVE